MDGKDTDLDLEKIDSDLFDSALLEGGRAAGQEITKEISLQNESSERNVDPKILKANSSTSEGRGGIVTARGTVDGLVIRLDGRVSKENLKTAAIEFLRTRKGFVAGNEVALEWVGSVPEDSFVDELSAALNSEFSITVRSSTLSETSLRGQREDRNKDDASTSNPTPSLTASNTAVPKVRGRSGSSNLVDRVFGGAGDQPSRSRDLRSGSANFEPSLFDGIEGFSDDDSGREESEVPSRGGQSDRTASRSNSQSSMLGSALSAHLGSSLERSGARHGVSGNLAVDSAAWDDPDARIIYGTLRSGQKIETEHSLLIFGDVNSGAELVAGGDIFVLGNLRGIAHAGAYDETGGGRVIFALGLQPTQLRIGMTISRGSTDGTGRQTENGFYPEIARVEGNLIVVEPFSTRPNGGKRR